MILDYSALEFDAFGRPEKPELILETLDEKEIGTLPSTVSDLHFNIKFSEPSEMSFTIPSHSEGVATHLYDKITGHKIVRTKNLGVYLLMAPSTTGDGISETKQVTGYSIEKALDTKKFVLDEGTYNFWNPTTPDDTVLGMILEIASTWGWTAGYVSPTLIGRYRTFDLYDNYLLSFVYNDAPEIYRCVFSFDPYERTINVYDADEDRGTIPVYLEYENALDELNINEMSEELFTAMRPYGADKLDIRSVNPLGTEWIYDLSYFISNGDIDAQLAQKWEAWQLAIRNRQEYFRGIVNLESSATAQWQMQYALVVDMKHELDDLLNQQSVTIQAIAQEFTEEGVAAQQQLLDEINAKITAKKEEIAEGEAELEAIRNRIDTVYTAEREAISSELALSNYFTVDELAILKKYFIECDMTEETFAASTVNTNISGQALSIDGGSISITDSAIVYLDMSADFDRYMYAIAGGKFSIPGDSPISGDIIRGTLETKNGTDYVISLYVGDFTIGDEEAPGGTVAISGSYTGLTSDIAPVTVDEVTTQEGTEITLTAGESTVYITADVSDYQKYSVAMELYDYAVDTLAEIATPTYEFDVASANILFEQKFAPFRDSLELGRGVHLKVSEGYAITPILIEMEFDFEDYTSFSLIFSNRFKRHDNVNTLSDMIESSYSSSRSFDSSKYIYNQTVGQASQVSDFMSSALNAAVNNIIGANNQSVVINGAGIQVGGDDNLQLRVVNNMIAITDNGWQSAKLAIGQFATEDGGTYFGVNADVIGGKLIVGNNLVIENVNDNGVMQFKVDASGVWLNNSTFVLQKDGGGKMLIDPQYGIVAGTGALFTTEGTTVIPSFVDEDGDLILDDGGMPQNANFFLDLQDGNAYFRGELDATEGSIGGWTIEEDYLHSGNGNTFVALNASGSNNALYAIWAGADNPENAPFYVMRNGNIHALNGDFSGEIKGATYKDASGNSMMDSDYKFTAGYLNLLGINVNNNFIVDQNGNVTVKGDIEMGPGSSINWASVSETNYTQSQAYQRANSAYNTATSAQSKANEADEAATAAQEAAEEVAGTVNGWKAPNSTYIDFKKIATETIEVNTLKGSQIFVFSDYGTSGGIRFTDMNSSYVFGNIKLSMSSNIQSAYQILDISGAGGLKLTTQIGSLWIQNLSGGAYLNLSINASSEPSTTCNGHFVPVGNTYDLGTNSPYICWRRSYAQQHVDFSDRTIKDDINYDVSNYDRFFDSLMPTSFRYKVSEGDGKHIGFIAQDIEDDLLSNELEASDFAGLIKDPKTDAEGRVVEGEYNYALCYTEFIALNTWQIQQLKPRVSSLETELAELKTQLAELKGESA